MHSRVKLTKTLRKIYPDNLPFQIGRYLNLAALFRRVFPGRKKYLVSRAPGRVNLIGEHTDYNGLPVLPMTLDKDIIVIAAPRTDKKINVFNADQSYGRRSFTISENIRHCPAGDWGNYLKAAAQALNRVNKNIKGLDCVIHGNIPAGAGLSSSSALVVVMGITLVRLNKLKIPPSFGFAQDGEQAEPLKLAQLLAEGEQYVGTRGGGMDQTVSLLGRKDTALKIDFFPLKIKYVGLPDSVRADYSFIVCHSLKTAQKSGWCRREYNERSQAGRTAAAILAKKFTEQFGPAKAGLNLLGDLRHPKFRFLLGDINKFVRQYFPKNICASKLNRRVLHNLTEWQRVEKSVRLLKAGRWKEFGRLMYQSHRSLRDNYEVSCPELEKLVGLARQFGAAGARLTGAGFGGCTINLVKKQDEQKFIDFMDRKYYRRYLKKKSGKDHIFICRSTPGAQARL